MAVNVYDCHRVSPFQFQFTLHLLLCSSSVAKAKLAVHHKRSYKVEIATSIVVELMCVKYYLLQIEIPMFQVPPSFGEVGPMKKGAF